MAGWNKIFQLGTAVSPSTSFLPIKESHWRTRDSGFSLQHEDQERRASQIGQTK